jgi:lambda family phage tail tape measure protein
MATIDRYKVQVDTAAAQKSVIGLKGALGALAGVFAAIKVGQTLKEIVNITAAFQDLRSSLKSVAGSAEGGNQAFAAIQELSTKTQFGVEELTKTYIKLGAAGIKPTERLMRVFTDAAAITTDQLGSLEAITDLFARTTSGGLGLEDLKRLADRGVPAFDILEKKLGLSRLEVSKFGKTAEGARAITTALAEGIEERFGGATADRLKNLSTQMSNFKIALRNSADTMGSAMGPAIGMVLGDLEKLITGNKNFADQLGAGIGRAIVATSATVQYLSMTITALGERIVEIVATPFRVLGEALDWVANKFGYTGSASEGFAQTIADALGYVANEAKGWEFSKFVGEKLDEYDRQLAKVRASTANFSGTLDDVNTKGMKDALSQTSEELKKMAELMKVVSPEELKKALEGTDTAIRDIVKSTEKMRFNMETANMDPLQKQIKTIERDLKTKLIDQIEELKKALTPENATLIEGAIKKITDATNTAIEEQTRLAKANDEAQKTFIFGWEDAFRTYVDEATNAANKARRIFEITTRGMEDAIVNFAKTGKFSFRDFINTVMEELLRSNIRELIAVVFGGKKSSGSIFSKIGNIFGGMFANGGFLPAGKIGIAGEAGPELINGPANITPMGAMGNITYNINAVDAFSFRQLLATEPEFLFAITEQGRRSLPQTRR